jgi:hypothetical protein
MTKEDTAEMFGITMFCFILLMGILTMIFKEYYQIFGYAGIIGFFLMLFYFINGDINNDI